MSELNCGADNCSYNQEHYCCKGDICVGGKHASRKKDTCCESFRNRCNFGTEASGELGAYHASSLTHPSKIISIDCEAVSCKYNSNYRCIADHVDIKGATANKSLGTECGTFQAQ